MSEERQNNFDRVAFPESISILQNTCNAHLKKKPYIAYEGNEGPDHSEHSHSLIRVFVDRLQNQWVV